MLTKEKVEKVYAMLDNNFTEADICKYLNITEDELREATNNSPSDFPSKEKEEQVSSNRIVVDKKKFDQYLSLKNSGARYEEIAEAIGVSLSYIVKLEKCKTYEDLTELRRKETDAKKKYRSSKNLAAKIVKEITGKNITDDELKEAMNKSRQAENVPITYIMPDPSVLEGIADNLERIANALETIKTPKKKRLFGR